MSVNKENFREHLDALEDVDTEALTTRFYHDDFTIRAGDSTMDLAGVLEFEKSLKSLVDFHFDVHQIVADESGIAIDAVETFDVLQDADVPNIGPARAGACVRLSARIKACPSGSALVGQVVCSRRVLSL
jgi:hypothetical protein